MRQISKPLPTTGTALAVPKVQAIKISATEIPGPTVLKPTTEEEIVPLKVQPVSLAASPASIKTRAETSIKDAEKTDELKCIPASSRKSEMLQKDIETPPNEAVITKLLLKSEIVQPMVGKEDEPAQTIDSSDIIKPRTFKESLELKDSCELTSMVLYTNKNVTVNIF